MKQKTLMIVLISVVLGVLLGGSLVRWVLSPKDRPAKGLSKTNSPPKVLYWRNPMNPAVHSDHPMKDSMGMDYLPVYAKSSLETANSVSVDPRIRQTLGIRIVPVERRTFSRTIRAAATVTFDARRIRTIAPRVTGWIREMSVLAPGDILKRGETVARIDSPELVSSEREDLIALGAIRANPKSQDDKKLWEASRERLGILGVPVSEIDRLETTGIPRQTIPLVSPYSGTVSSVRTPIGGEIAPGTPLVTVADLSRVWVEVAIDPGWLPWIGKDAQVRLATAATPTRRYEGTLRLVSPELDEKSRTIKGRVAVDNPDGSLKPGMYLEATIRSAVHPNVLVIPRESLIRTGNRTMVITEVESGHFRPAFVTVGARSDHSVEVLSGLSEGDRVVSSGQFLLDAESRIENVSGRMEGGQP